MEIKNEKTKTVKFCISMSAELYEVLLMEANLRKMNRSRLIETILRENKEIKKTINRIHEITKGEEVLLTAGHGVQPDNKKHIPIAIQHKNNSKENNHQIVTQI